LAQIYLKLSHMGLVEGPEHSVALLNVASGHGSLAVNDYQAVVEAVEGASEVCGDVETRRSELLHALLSLYRRPQGSSIAPALSRLMAKFMDPTSLPHLQMAYSAVVEALEEVFGLLRGAVEDGLKAREAMRREQEGVALLGALLPLTKIKGSIIIVSRGIVPMA
jgi:hypothetical protein